MKGGRLRILYVAPYQLSTLTTRPRLLLGAMAERHDIDVLTLHRRSVAPPVSIGIASRSFRSRPFDRMLALRHLTDPAYPLQTMAAASRRLHVEVNSALQQHDYDLMHVEHVRALPYARSRRDLPVIFDAVDCVSQLFQLAAAHRRPPAGWVFRAEAGRLARCEEAALASVDSVIVASQRDAVALGQRSPGTRIGVVTNPVDLERFIPGAQRHPKTVVMTGKMSFHANSAGAHWLCERIWPLVRAEHPDARLVIAGAQQSRSLRRFACGDITCSTGFVRDMPGMIGSAAIAVAPLPYAVGIQNKVLEALACATPVVATPTAVGDLELRDGRDVLIGSTAAEVAAKINALLGNVAVARSIGEAGRHYVEAHHSIAALTDRLESEYLEMLRTAHGRRAGVLGAVAAG